VKARDDALEPIGLHECRHTFASLMVAAGIRAERNPVAIAKQLCTLMGHASITQTLDRYGHLFPAQRARPPGHSTRTWRGTDDLLVQGIAGGQRNTSWMTMPAPAG
jgi:hypothetical protein